MRIQGLQKLTLLDYPGKTACTIFLGGCNFRCPFCHNAALVTGVEDHENFSEEELFDFLKRRQGILDGVCISGGEPLICPDLDELLKKIRDMGVLDQTGYERQFSGAADPSCGRRTDRPGGHGSEKFQRKVRTDSGAWAV